MLPRKIGRPPAQTSALTPEVLAVCVALVLVGGLLAAMFGRGLLEPGTRLVGPDGCTAQVWRNPVTGRTEAVGRSRLDGDGQPVP